MGEPMVLVATRVNRAPDGRQATVWSVLGVYPGGDFMVEEAGSWEECGTNTAARRIIERLAYGHGGHVTWATEGGE